MKNIGLSETRKLCLQLSKYKHGEDKEEACLGGKESTETSRNMPVSQLRILVFRAWEVYIAINIYINLIQKQDMSSTWDWEIVQAKITAYTWKVYKK